MKTDPLISIITVVYNGKEFLEETIQSVINQTYKNIEYIIIDGGSTDGTVDIIKKYEEYIDYWVSEKDDGIYDAMNKGLKVASGEWVNFMNAGDRFYNSNVLSRIFTNQNFDKDVKVIYGDTEVKYDTFKKMKKKYDLKLIPKVMPFSHQSVFFDSVIHKKRPYNLTFSICADYDLICDLYNKKIKFFDIDCLVSTCSVGGVSDLQNIDMTRETSKISLKYFPSFSNWLFFKKMLLDTYIKNMFKKFLPKDTVEWIKKHKL